MKKKTLTTVALGAVTLAAGMAGNVHADSVKVTKQQIGDETKITTTTTKDVNQQKIAQDKQNISSQQTVVSNAKSSLDKAKVNASSASQVVSSAQSRVNDAKKALDAAKASQPDQIKHQVAIDQSQVNTDKQNISSTQSSITTDKNNIAKDQQAINNVGQKAQQDQNKLNNDQSKLSSAQSTLNNDQNKLNSVNGQIKSLAGQNDIPAVETTDFGEAFLKALSQDTDYSQTNGGDLWNMPAMKEYLQQHNMSAMDAVTKLLDGNLWLDIPNETDPKGVIGGISGLDYNDKTNQIEGFNSKTDDYKIDPTHLTDSQMNEINVFAIKIINEFRAKAGLTPLKLTQTVIKNAAEVAKEYNDDNWGIGNRKEPPYHDEDAMWGGGFSTEDAAPDRVSQSTLQEIDKANNFTKDVSHLSTNFTMNNLETMVASNIVGLILTNDGHGQALMAPDALTAGLSINKYGDILIDILDNIDSSKGQVWGNPTANNPKAVNYYSLSSEPNLVGNTNANQVANLQKEANQLQDQVNKDKQVVNDLQNQVNADKAQLQKDTPAGLQQQLQNDQKKLANDQATLQKQQQKLAQDEAQLKANQSKLNSITPEDIANAQKALEQAQTNYNNAVKALNDAQSKANASNDELAKAQQNYINALNKLNELKQILENDEKQITTTSVQWIKNQHPATTSAMGNKVVLHSSSKTKASSGVSEKKMNAKTTVNSEKKMNAKSAVNSEKKVNVKLAESNEKEANTVKLAQADAIHFTSEAPVSSKKTAKKNVLPQMGDENSNKTVWGEISLAMAGVLATLGLADRKRRN